MSVTGNGTKGWGGHLQRVVWESALEHRGGAECLEGQEREEPEARSRFGG